MTENHYSSWPYRQFPRLPLATVRGSGSLAKGGLGIRAHVQRHCSTRLYVCLCVSDQAEDSRETQNVEVGANLGDRSSLGTGVARSGSLRSSLQRLAKKYDGSGLRTLELSNVAL
jgi:hypothetical protein